MGDSLLVGYGGWSTTLERLKTPSIKRGNLAIAGTQARIYRAPDDSVWVLLEHSRELDHYHDLDTAIAATILRLS